MPGAPNRTKKPVHISKKPYTFHESANPKITKRDTLQQATPHGIPARSVRQNCRTERHTTPPKASNEHGHALWISG